MEFFHADFFENGEFRLKTDIITLVCVGQSLNFFQSSLAPLLHEEEAVFSDLLTYVKKKIVNRFFFIKTENFEKCLTFLLH